MNSDIYNYPLRVPHGMKILIMRYAVRRRMSFNQACLELFETHPEIQSIYSQLTNPDIKSES